jgi:predicted permease
MKNLLYSMRRLGGAPGFTLVFVVSLGIGMGLNVAVFSVANGVMLKRLSLHAPERMVTIARVQNQTGQVWNELTDDELRAIEETSLFAEVVIHDALVTALSDGSQSRIVSGELVSANYFQVFNVAPRVGRLFSDADEVETHVETPVVISESLWKAWFQGDPQVLGTSVRLGGHPVSIVGVAPHTFKGTWVPSILSAQVWVPFRAAPDVLNRGAPARPVHRTLAILRPGISRSHAHAVVEAIGSRFPVEGPARRLAVLPGSHGIEPRQFVTAGAAISGVVVAVSVIVVIIVCANLMNLLLARNAERAPEIAIRMALGASPQQIVRMVMSETVLLLMGSTLLGAGVTHAAIRLMQTVPLPVLDGIPIALDPTPDLTVLSYAVAVLVLTVLVAGLLPARVLAHADPMRTLSSTGGSGGITLRNRRLSRRLVYLQIVFSVLLLLGAGLTAKSAWRASRLEPGFDASRSIVATMDSSYRSQSDAEFRSALLRRVRALPGTVAASLASTVPGMGAARTVPLFPVESANAPNSTLRAFLNPISSDFFSTLGLKLNHGRDFTDLDYAADRHVVIVSRAIAERLWPNQDAIGRKLMTSEHGTHFEVIGVAPDLPVVVGSDLGNYVYLPLSQDGTAKLSLLVREREPGVVLGSIYREIQDVDPDVPVLDVQPLGRLVALRQAPNRLFAQFVVVLATIGFAIALLGIYGTMAYWLSRRTREFGIHKAVGATDADIKRMVVREVAPLLIRGVVTSMVIGLILGEGLRGFLVGVNLRDPLIFSVVPLAFLAIAMLACYVAARRVILVDPSRILRIVG